MDASRNDMAHFLQLDAPDKVLQFSQTIVAAHQNDLIDASCPVEGLKRVRNDRLIPQKREQFVEAHALAAARGDYDGAQHG